MKKLPLICDRCGSSLVYSGQMVVTCTSCGVPWALVAEKKDVFSHVSYFPLPAPGKMAVPFKIALGRKIRESTEFLVGDGGFTCGGMYFDDQGVVQDKYPEIDDDIDDMLYVGKRGPKRHNPLRSEKKGISRFFGQSALQIQEPEVDTMMTLSISEVVADKRIVGHTVWIDVRSQKWEKEANVICSLIEKHFSILAPCTLSNG